MHDPYQYFKIEAAELVEEMTKGLLQLEKSVDDVDLVKTLFRYAHTLKGAASVVRLGVISNLAHRVEDWLAVFRDKGLRAGGEDITLLLEAVDVISLLIDAVSEGKAEDCIDVGPILQKLEKGEEAVLASGTDALDSPPSYHDGDSLADKGDQQAIVTQTGDRSEAPDEREGASRHKARTQPQETGERKIAETLRIETDDMQLMTDFANEIVINILHLKQLASSFREGKKSREQHHESLDIFCDQLEQALEQTGRFSQEMSDLIMDMRLVSVGEGAFFFEKTVRDLVHFLDKDVEFVLEGEANEVDRSLLAGVKEPVYHLLRNSIIHGVESVDERLAAGKTRQARINLEFKKNGEWLEIACQDDGRGLDAQKIKEHVIQKNMMDVDAAEALSHQEVLHLIFESGFFDGRNGNGTGGTGGGARCR